MTSLFIDLWQDLREKRLWPVAVGLLAGIAAIPIVLFKPTSQPSIQAPLATGAPALQPLPIVSVDSGPVTGSKLQSFSQKNPFKPLADAAKPAVASTAPAPSKSSANAPTSASPASSATSHSGGSPSSSTSKSSGAPAPSAATTKMVYFRFSPELRFGTPGHLKTLKHVKLLALLPSSKQAVVAYMGVASDYKSATFFLADPGYQAKGRGICNATGAACRFIKLTLDRKHSSESFVSPDGRTKFDLKLVRIDRETLTPAQAKGHSTDIKPHLKSAGARHLLLNMLTLSSLLQQSTTVAPPLH